MPELATAWVTIAASARGMRAEIARELQQAERNARIAPQLDSRRMIAEADRAGRQVGDRLSSGISSAAKTAAKAFAAVTIGAGVVDQFKQVMSVGMDWTNNMNTLQAVTGATADQLKAAGDAARALGNDISLPATSANDAASAMTELAKGGFTVQQAMDAAKGSLALASAAQISATEAATIQSQALQAFGLNAGSAGKMADTLANAANASSAEITDVAQAMAQAGTVANQFGLSAEDTASAIGLLANNGIKGSDAGTLLKSSLLALTDQGNPAQGAIEELGLTVYDAQGKFVGLHQLFGELGEASKRLTPEQYQAATAVLFGSDAMRLAGVAAKDGSQSYDLMRTAIDRQGAAADVAAAKTKGLPGAWERVKNSLESLQLGAYDSIEGPLTGLADNVSAGLGRVGPMVSNAWKQLSTNPTVVKTWNDMGAAFATLGAAAADVWPALKQIATSVGVAAGAVGVGVWKAFVVALEAAGEGLQMVTPLVDTLGGLMSDHQGLVTAAVGAWLLFKTVPGIMQRVTGAVNPALSNMARQFQTARTGVTNFGDAYRTHLQYLRQANPTISTAGQHIRTLGSAASGAATGGLSLMRTAAGGVLTALGGWTGAGIMAVTAAIGLIAQKHSEAAQAARDQRRAEQELRDTLDSASGIVTQATRDSVARRFTTEDGSGPTVVQRAQSLGVSTDALVDASTGTGDPRALEYIRNIGAQRGVEEGLRAIQGVGSGGVAFNYETIKQQAADAGVSMDELSAALLKQGDAWDTVQAKFVAASADPSQALNLQALIDKMPDANESFITLTQAVEEQRNQLSGATQGQKDYIQARSGLWQMTDEGIARFRSLGAEIVAVPDNKTVVVNSLTEDAQTKLEALKYKVERMPDGTVKITAEDKEAYDRFRVLVEQIRQPVEIPVRLQPLDIPDEAWRNRRPTNMPAFPGDTTGQRADGAIVAQANGSLALRQIIKPSDAGLYAGRGAGTIFAEKETGGEAYIPLAPGKRGRSTAILAEVARLFGLSLQEDGGITVDAVKQFASQIAGGSYQRGGPAALSGTDCSGAQAAIANFITGGSGRFATGSAAEALASRGFMTGDPPPGVAAYWIGWRNGGPGGGHAAGTIVDPMGGNVNVEMGGANGGGAYGAGAQGASGFPNRAWIQIAGGEDPNAPDSFGSGSASVQRAQAGVTSARAGVTSAQASLDQADAALSEATAKGESADKIAVLQKKRDAAEQRLTAAQERQTAAETKLADATEKSADGAESGGMDGQSFGQQLFSGLLQGMGLDGSVFSNPLEWPNMKSGIALANWGGGLLKNMIGASGPGGSAGLPGIGDFMNGPLTPIDPATTQHGQGQGQAPGLQFVINGNVGMDPRDVTQKFAAKHNEVYRGSGLPAVRPM